MAGIGMKGELGRGNGMRSFELDHLSNIMKTG